MIPRREDEILLYAHMRQVATLSETGNRLIQVADMIWLSQSLGIPAGRAGYIVAKWEGRGWWYTSSAAGGWFTSESPSALLPFSVIK